MTIVTPRAMKILVVEDEPTIAMTIEYVIESAGHVMIGPMARLEDALEAADGDSFDCAILDVNIQGGLTYPVADILMTRNLPFVLSTGYSSASLPQNLQNCTLLTKPYTERALTEQIDLLVARVAK